MKKHQFSSEHDLENAVNETIVDVMDEGDGSPEIVAEAVCDGYPELCIRYGRHKIEGVVKRSFYSELPLLSEAYTALFVEFNKQYFADQLPNHLVKVFYDVRVDRSMRTSHVNPRQVIRLQVTAQEWWMIANLLRMVEVAGSSNQHRSRKEMERLTLMGAPVRKETERGDWACPSESESSEALRVVGRMLIGVNRYRKEIPII